MSAAKTLRNPEHCVIEGAGEAACLEQFRNDFSAFEEGIYMNLAGRGILSRTTRKALDAGLDDQMMGRVSKSLWKAAAEESRQRFGDLLNASPTEIACTKNVSE